MTHRNQVEILDGIVATSRSSVPFQPASVVPEGQLQHIADLVASLKSTQNTSSVEQHLQQLDEEVKRFRVQLGLQGQDEEAFDGFQSPWLTGMNLITHHPDSRKREHLPYSLADTKK